jgi:hypothetical protein
MRKLLALALAFLTFVCLLAPTQNVVQSAGQGATSTAQRLSARATGQTPMLADLRELCDQIGRAPMSSN